MEGPGGEPADRLASVLDGGLALVVVLAPLPLGAVLGPARLALELGALALVALWVVRSRRAPTILPSRAVLVGLAGLLALAGLQLVPLGPRVVGTLSPQAVRLRETVQPPPDAAAAEERLLGVAPRTFDAGVALSLDPPATASALRTGLALAALLLVATTVAARRGARRLAVALLASGAAQGLYGLLVVASGHDRVWHIPKQYYLDSATGTFINRNHFAGYLVLALSCGTALVASELRRDRPRRAGRAWLDFLGGSGGRVLLLAVALLAGLAGLLASLSRAGIALGVGSILVTVWALRLGARVRTRLVVAIVLLALAAVPLAMLGGERLVDRYTEAPEEIGRPGGRGRVWLDTLAVSAAFPAFGTGFGTFASVYPLYRSPEVRKLYVHAHNDFLQAMAEGGAPGTLFVLLLLFGTLRGVPAALRGERGDLGVGVAAGLAAFLLHSIVDFNLHVPSNAATAAVLAGMLQGLPWTGRR